MSKIWTVAILYAFAIGVSVFIFWSDIYAQVIYWSINERSASASNVGKVNKLRLLFPEAAKHGEINGIPAAEIEWHWSANKGDGVLIQRRADPGGVEVVIYYAYSLRDGSLDKLGTKVVW